MHLVLQLLRGHIANHKKQYALLFFSAGITTLLWIADPLYTSYAIDQLTHIADGNVNVWWVFGLWALLFAALSISNGFSKYLGWQAGNKIKMEQREKIYEHIVQLDIDYHVNKRGGESVQILEDASDELRYVQRMMLDLLPTTLSSIAFLVISLFVNTTLTLILYAGVALFTFFSVYLSVKTSALQDAVNKLWVSSIGRATDALTNIFMVKSSANELRELSLMKKDNDLALISQKRINKRWAWLEAVNFYMLLRIALIGSGTLLLVKGELTLGELYYFQYTFFRALTPFEMLSNYLPEWNKTLGKLKLAQEILDRPVLITNKPDAKILKEVEGNISLKDISFAYGEAETLQHVSLDVKSGERIALVGHSGAGKSTLALLLNRFYDVTDGAITVDGVDMRDLDMHWWRGQIGLVLQENIMFNDTVLENIRYARPDATLEEVVEAAKRASADEFIENLPKKYDTVIGERGIKLSGGERQRIAIARAILKKPTVVVLDEATSALDSITERTVQEGIKELIKGRTSFIIAHRLSTVRSVDRIAVLENGKLVACAPHEELLKISPTYKEMVELQHGGILAE